MIADEVNQMDIQAVMRKFSRFDIENEEDLSKFNVGILDVFSYTLSEVEAKILLNSFEEHNLKYENRFICTISSIFEKNGGTVLVYLAQCNYDSYFVCVDGVECNFSKNDEKRLIKIDNLDDLESILKLSTRELFFSNFFFININTVIIANYDLSFPVYCVNQKDFTWITNEANKNNLFIRK